VGTGSFVLVVVGIASTVVGCYGSTEPATNVSAAGATLHGRGTTNNGPASAFFEYWPTADASKKQTTPERSLPGGVSGPFSEPITGLSSGAAYSFRLCGHDAGGPTICAQTRGIGDSVAVKMQGDANHYVQVDARSGGSGQDANGAIGVVVSGIPRAWNVICLAVTGNRAIVAGERSPGDYLIFGFQDGSLTYRSPSNDLEPDCAAIDYDSLTPHNAISGTVAVHDEP
jgi:hypothetical protein